MPLIRATLRWGGIGTSPPSAAATDPDLEASFSEAITLGDLFSMVQTMEEHIVSERGANGGIPVIKTNSLTVYYYKRQ